MPIPPVWHLLCDTCLRAYVPTSSSSAAMLYASNLDNLVTAHCTPEGTTEVTPEEGATYLDVALSRLQEVPVTPPKPDPHSPLWWQPAE